MIIMNIDHLFTKSTTGFIVKNEHELKKVIKVLQEEFEYTHTNNINWMIHKYKLHSNIIVRSLNNIKKITIAEFSGYCNSYKAEALFFYKNLIY